FGNKSNPSGDISIEGNVNSELYLTASNDDGLSWDKPQNLTNSETPGCAPGDCDSDNWASMARYGRPANDCGGGNFPTEGNVLDIMYINDKMPGGVIQPQSMYWTVNPVMWLTTPCRDVGEICDPNDQWPTYAHDFGRTSKSGLEFGDLTGLTRQWVYESSNSGELSAFSSPVIANDIVYVAYNQSLHAIDLLTGAPLWDTYTHGDYTQVIFNKLRSAPTIDVANNRIYFGTGATQGFVCADATTGDIIWARGVMVDPLPGTPGDTRWAHSVIIGDAIYFGDENGQLYALDKNAGYEIHYEPLGLPIYTAPSYGVVDVLGTPTDMLFFGGAQGIPGPGGIFGMEPVGGIFIPHWFYENPDNATLSDGFPSTPVFYQGDLLAHSYVGNPANNNGYNGYRINIDPSDGSEIWSDYEMGRPLYSSPAVFDGIAYFGSDAYTDISSVHPDVLGLKAVDIATNAILWQETSANPADMTPMPPSVTCDPYVFSGMRNGKWRIHDAVTGDLQLQYHLDDDIVMCTALAYGSDGREYAVVNTYGGNSTGTGRVYAFAVEDVVRPRMHITDFERTIKTIEPSEIDPVLCTCSVAISNLGDATLYYTATLVAGDPPREAATSSEVNDEMIPIQATVKSDSKEAASDRGSSWASWVSPYPMGDVVNGQIYTGGLPVSFIFEVDPTALSPGDNYFYIDVESTDPDFAPWEDPQPTPQARMKMIVDMPAYGCGDANSDGSLNVGDAVFLINMVFKSGPEPVPYDLGEVNCDGTINVGDAVWMINYVFKSGPAPCDCVAP
ncbi:MAG: PQQ-binding-like beta-propeller repeat protein, partial [FCB group bacterium]|nr:PQQ-binding-like beta-propeller repeat protein [FCB group bacterium]